jgi:hypothetical protein
MSEWPDEAREAVLNAIGKLEDGPYVGPGGFADATMEALEPFALAVLHETGNHLRKAFLSHIMDVKKCRSPCAQDVRCKCRTIMNTYIEEAYKP